jgi:uncharacterized membrane protein YdcZ (DUF606 family)
MPETDKRSVQGRIVPEWIMSLLWAMVALIAVFCVLIFYIPLDTYRFYGHILEAGTALFCMACCLYAYRAIAGRTILLLAAFVYGGYALSTTFWYLYSVALGRQYVFVSVSELGFVGFIFFLIAAIIIEFPKRKVLVRTRAALMGFFLLAALLVAGTVGLSLPDVLLIARILIVALLIDIAVSHGVHQYPLLWLGILLRCLSAVLYGFRETLFIAHRDWAFVVPFTGNPMAIYDLLSLVGPLIIFSFLFIQLGLFDYLNSLNAGTAAASSPASRDPGC